MNEFDELNKQCMEIAKRFNQAAEAAKELLVQAEELIKLVQQIDQVI